ICTEEVPPLQDAAPWIDPGLADAVHRAMSREPSERYPSMAAFAEALAPYATPPEELFLWTLAPVPRETRTRVAPRGLVGGATTQQPVSTTGSTSAPPRP